ncbi:MAG: PAS domain S-box protein, partial [Desulfuromonadales bacterium]|nr:PAS domain S-box protein [Desulfuromonadales bacterium]
MKDELQKERFLLRELARSAAGRQIPDLRELSPREVATLIHEFGVYQMELETQNEELRETRLALEETRDRYRELYDFAPVGFFTFGRTGEILEANLTGCALLGKTRGELLGSYFSEFLTREGGDDLYRHLGKVVETGERQVAEVVCPDGRSLRLESVADSSAGRGVVCRTAVTDITASRAAAASLRESEAVYHGLFADNHAVMLLIDPESGAIADANRAAAAYYGYPQEALQQMRIFDLHTLPPAKIREQMTLARSRGKRRFEFRHRLADGAERDVEVYSGPIRRGGRSLLYSIIHDITDRKQAEAALQEAKLGAEEASRAKSEFLANMSHEIRTPMTVFMAAIEHLLQIDHNPERRQLLGMAEQSAEWLRALIDDILDFSRIEARRVELEEEPFDLRALVQSTVELLSLQAQKKKLQLKMEISPAISPLVFGDPARLNQVLINLIGNAIKFTHRGEVRVGLQRDGDRLKFTVSDTGIGIPQAKRDLIFHSFSQADS